MALLMQVKIWNGLMKIADTDGDGKLSYAEFKNIVKVVDTTDGDERLI